MITNNDYKKYCDEMCEELLLRRADVTVLLKDERTFIIKRLHPLLESGALEDHELSMSFFESTADLAENSIKDFCTYNDSDTGKEELIECTNLDMLGEKLIENNPEEYIILPSGTVMWYCFQKSFEGVNEKILRAVKQS